MKNSRGKKFVEVRPYTRKVNGKIVRVHRHDRSNPLNK